MMRITELKSIYQSDKTASYVSYAKAFLELDGGTYEGSFRRIDKFWRFGVNYPADTPTSFGGFAIGTWQFGNVHINDQLTAAEKLTVNPGENLIGSISPSA
jgi:hypothetical protein